MFSRFVHEKLENCGFMVQYPIWQVQWDQCKGEYLYWYIIYVSYCIPIHRYDKIYLFTLSMILKGEGNLKPIIFIHLYSIILSYLYCFIYRYHGIGWWEKKSTGTSPIFDGKKPWFPGSDLPFSKRKAQASDHISEDQSRQLALDIEQVGHLGLRPWRR